jgi:hypothetical protein
LFVPYFVLPSIPEANQGFEQQCLVLRNRTTLIMLHLS